MSLRIRCNTGDTLRCAAREGGLTTWEGRVVLCAQTPNRSRPLPWWRAGRAPAPEIEVGEPCREEIVGLALRHVGLGFQSPLAPIFQDDSATLRVRVVSPAVISEGGSRIEHDETWDVGWRCWTQTRWTPASHPYSRFKGG
jgi:hypothetical protein